MFRCTSAMSKNRSINIVYLIAQWSIFPFALICVCPRQWADGNLSVDSARRFSTAGPPRCDSRTWRFFLRCTRLRFRLKKVDG